MTKQLPESDDSDRQAGISESSENVVFLYPTLTGEACVERINQFDFYELARKLQKIAALRSPVRAEDALVPLWGAQAALANLLKGDPIELGVSRVKAKQFKDIVDQLLDAHFREDDGEGGKKWRFPKSDTPDIPDWDWNWIKEALANFEMIFAEEMREAATYSVPTRGIYNTAKLVDAADSSFPPELAGHVPEKSKVEWRAAGRCMAFGMFTACGFHVARAVEGTLEAYFQTFNGGPDKRKKNWGDYLAALEALAKGGSALKPDPKTLAELRQMKDDWRNPLMHPRVILGEADSRSVFNNGETLIMLMVREVIAMAGQEQQPALIVLEGEGERQGA